MRRAVLCLALATALPFAVRAETSSYLCVTDYAIGYAFQGGRWMPTTFTAGVKWIVRRARPEEVEMYGVRDATWGLFEHGSAIASAGCAEPSAALKSALGGALFCQGIMDVQVNRDTLRFQLGHRGGYTLPSTPEGKSEPALSIGRCTPL